MLDFVSMKGREDLLKYSYKLGWNSERFIRKGDVLYTVQIGISVIKQDYLEYPVYADVSGYAIPDPQGSYCGYTNAEDQALVFTVLTDIGKVADRFPFKCIASKDEFDGSLKVSWDKVAGKNSNTFAIGNFKLQLVLANNRPQLRVEYAKSGRVYTRGDRFEIFLGNNEVLSFSLTENPSKCDKGLVEFYLLLNESDFNSLKEHSIVKARLFKPQNSDQRLVGGNDLCKSGELSLLLFKRYVEAFSETLDKNGFYWGEIIEAPSTSDPTCSDPCYVYLMVDTTNGFHKIGISNKPEYREGTLQSEKPTIELVCAKQYPSRLIASTIESSLHTASNDKRLRGEWFDLNEQEVNDIKLTLK